jgi:glycosyltransferase involved in cell wall biosynthesis
MRLSVVMPCHNRLHLLRDAIETVRLQSIDDWQLVVFDNASSDPIREHVASLDDPRIVFDRSDVFLPVTESWNRAMALADGDYCVLLGDDDGLLPDAVRTLKETVERFDNPDFIYADIYQFWHEGVAPWRRAPHLVDVRHGFFFAGRSEPFRLSPEEARRALIGSLDLKINFSFNSQACFYRRGFVSELTKQSGFFRSPFPDYYIANAAMTLSRSTVVLPQPVAFAGVSKASYGYALYNKEQSRGDKLLNIKYDGDPVYEDVKDKLLPGPTYNTNFILAMEYVARAVAGKVPHPAAFDRYRRMQIIAILRDPDLRKAGWTEMRSRLDGRERIFAAGLQMLLSLSRHSKALDRWLQSRLDALSSFAGTAPTPVYSPDLECKSAVDVYRAFQAGLALG